MTENRIDLGPRETRELRKVYFAGGPLDGKWDYERPLDSQGYRFRGFAEYHFQTIALRFGVNVIVGVYKGTDLAEWVAHVIANYCNEKV